MGWIKSKADQQLTDWSYFCTNSFNARTHLYQAGDQILANNWSAARDALYNCADDWGTGIGYIVYSPPFNYGACYKQWQLWYYVENNIEGGGEVTMDAILSAMLSADPEQVKYFVGLVDAYRQAIWNQPFDEQFYAALARGFMIWP